MVRPSYVCIVRPDSDSASNPQSREPKVSSAQQRGPTNWLPSVSGAPDAPTPDSDKSTTHNLISLSTSSSIPHTIPSGLALSIPTQKPTGSEQGHRSMNQRTRAAQPPSSSRQTNTIVSKTPTPLLPLSTPTKPPRIHSLPQLCRPSQSDNKFMSTSLLDASTSPSLNSDPSPLPIYPTEPIPYVKKSRSRPNLRSQSSQRTLRLKRSISTLVPQPPTEEVLAKRAYNLNPSMVFVNRLPTELLGVIFLLLIDPLSTLQAQGYGPSSSSSYGLTTGRGAGGTGGVDTRAPRTVSQVCHLWRCIALNEPILWARTLNLREGPKWIIETLKRSGECIIDVVGHREISLIRNGRDEDPRGRNSVLGIVLGELRRIRKLYLTIEGKEEWSRFVDVLSKNEAPVLESLTVKSSVRRVSNVPGVAYGDRYGGHHSVGFGWDGLDAGGIGGSSGEDAMRLSERMFKGSAPALKNLSLSMVTLGSVEPLPYLSRLTTLQVTDLEDAYLMSVWSWLSIVRQTPLLQSLILRSVLTNDVPPSSPSHHTNVVLKKLKSIELKGSMMEACEFLEKLVIPGECKLVMSLGRANNSYAASVLGAWLRERKMRSEQMEGILRTPIEVVREQEMERRRARWLLVHPSVAGLRIKVSEVVPQQESEEHFCEDAEDEGDCVMNLALSFGATDQSEERHRLVLEIFNILTQALQMVYEDKGGFDALNLSLFGIRDGIQMWNDQLVQFLAGLDRVEHLQEISGYTASVLFPLLVQSTLHKQHSKRGSAASLTSIISTSPSERFRLNVLLPSLSKITLAFVEFGKNVDDEFEASCDVRAVPDFVRRRYGLGKEVGGISVVRQKVGSLSVRFECCSGPKGILDELRKLGVEFGLGWACDFEHDLTA